MPIPFLTPLALGLTGASAVAGIAQGIGDAKANDPLQKRNSRKLAELVHQERTGELGLSGSERTLLDQQLMSPVAAAAAAQRRRGEQLLASAGGVGGASGADLARLREEQARSTGAAAQNASLQIAQADQARKLQQENEIEQRKAMQAALKRDDWNAVWGNISQGLGTVGAMAGAPPGTFGIAGMFGEKLTPQDLATLKKLPAATRARLFDEALFGAGAGDSTSTGGVS